MRGIALAVLVMMLTGCAAFRSSSSAVMDRGDHLVEQGDYGAAVRAYDEVLVKYPDGEAAPRARAMRELLEARSDAARLRETLAARESELGRLRQEMQRLSAETERLRAETERLRGETDRLRGETDRLRGEADRLRADLENLKQIDLREERRKR